MNTENIFAGIPYTLLSDFKFKMDSEFDIEINPQVKTNIKKTNMSLYSENQAITLLNFTTKEMALIYCLKEI
ncbi:hypothetical protein BST83_02080 [Polaribacter filamentus]|uniref:Uncharacterized protein n=1 Tax=Polaribacter filamentus TaxID=53483 RepID=A0A2S7KUA0_9FLAO|nr:hypothetical protein BST83_02080 [Polaribacter filamentus]